MLRKVLLRDFLKSRRGRLQPKDVGLPVDPGRRLTPGLRRSEVARLAGVSSDWYTRFEMGRERAMTLRLAGSVAKALCLNVVETEYLESLVRPTKIAASVPSLTGALRWISEHVQNVMLVAYDRWMNAVDWNATAQAFLSLTVVDDTHGNALLRAFGLPPATNTSELQARLLLALFRRNLARDPANREANAVLASLKAAPDFDRLWQLQEVASFEALGASEFTVHHSHYGTFRGLCTYLELPGSNGYAAFISPVDEVSLFALRSATADHFARKSAGTEETLIERSRGAHLRVASLLAEHQASLRRLHAMKTSTKELLHRRLRGNKTDGPGTQGSPGTAEG